MLLRNFKCPSQAVAIRLLDTNIKSGTRIFFTEVSLPRKTSCPEPQRCRGALNDSHACFNVHKLFYYDD